MTPSELIAITVDALRGADISYFVTGSIASSFYGENRYTHDIDIVVFVDADDERLDALLRRFPEPEFYASREAAIEASRSGGQFNVIHGASMLKVDFMIARHELYDRTRLSRRKERSLPGVAKVMLAAPEDVILKKLEYYKEGGSEKHLRDIASMLLTSGEPIDRTYIQEWAAKRGLSDEWQAVLDRVGR